MKRWFVYFLVVLFAAACSSQSDPGSVVQAYLNARVAADAGTMQSLSCAEWEAQAQLQAQSFRSMQAELRDVACSKVSEDGESALVRCTGKIVTSYNGENRDWPLSDYQLKKENGEWKMCGEAGSES